MVYYKRNISIIASICQQLGIDLILSTPLSLFKQNNSREEQMLIADFINKEFYLDFIEGGKNILRELSEDFSVVHYFDPRSVIIPNINLLRDRYHPTIAGNIRIAEELHKYIKAIEYKLTSLN